MELVLQTYAGSLERHHDTAGKTSVDIFLMHFTRTYAGGRTYVCVSRHRRTHRPVCTYV